MTTTTMTALLLPQANLKAKDLPEDYLPHKEIIKAYQDTGNEFNFDSEATVHDRVYQRFWTLVNGNVRIKSQPIEQQISGMHRVKDAKGNEWLMYHIMLLGVNHIGEQVDFSDLVGRISVPVFQKKLNLDTEEVELGPLIHNHKTVYTIPFTKSKIDEISHFFTEPLSCSIVDRTGTTRHSCSLEEFKDMPYNELINFKTGLTEYMKNRRGSKVYS